MIGLPDAVTACLFDLDGVLTSTARLHRAAWKQTFDDLLRERDGEHFSPFTEADYNAYVDGLPRYDGVRTFLASRGIELSEGSPSDDAGTVTVHGVGNRKNDLVQRIIADEGVDAFPGSVRYLAAADSAGLGIAVVTSSANATAVLAAARLQDFVRVQVDGTVLQRERLRGKPAPDSFLAAARELGVEPGRAAVFEDAQAGVRAGSDGGFGYVVGVDRVGGDQADALREHGADIVVTDLAELLEESA